MLSFFALRASPASPLVALKEIRIPTGGTNAGGSSGTAGSGGKTASGGDAGTGGDNPAGGDAGTGGAGGDVSTDAGEDDVSVGTGGDGGDAGSGGGPVVEDAGADAATVSVKSIVPTLDGYLWVGKCAAGKGVNKDCPIDGPGSVCVGSSPDFFALGAFVLAKHKVGGTPGTQYMIDFEVRGVTGGKTYVGGTPRNTETFNQTGNDGWQVGGLPTDSKWNTYEIHVSPPVPGQPVNKQSLTCTGCPKAPDNVYYTNSIKGTDGTHETFPIKFDASFPVMGGGTITLVIHDSNCLGQQNCGPDPDPKALCVKPAPGGPRTIDISGMPKPTGFVQPSHRFASPNTWYPQWLLFDVKSVTQK